MRSQFGHVQKVSDGRWRIYWSEDKLRHSKTVYGTRDDAEKALAAVRVGNSKHAVTWGEYWDAVVAPSFDGLAAKTVSDYERVWRVELSRTVKDTLVPSTGFQTVQEAVSAISAPSVQRHAFRLFRKMCNMAIRDGLLDRNPCDRTTQFKESRKRDKTVLEANKVMGFLESVKGTRYEPLVLLELGGGLRHEEACALLWDDVRPWRGYAAVRVERALVLSDGRPVLKGTKNRHSVRTVVIGEPFASRLLELKTDGAVMPHRFNRPDEVCAGMFAPPDSVTSNWRYWCSRHGVGYVRFGDMRSIYATLHMEAMSSGELVSLSMGHAGTTTRTQHYAKTTMEGLARIADNLAAYLDSCADKDEMPDDFPF